VLFVTHQVDEAVYLSDRIIVLTARPGRLKADIAVDLPRPRTLATKRSPEFAGYVDRVWRLIEEEVRESMELEMRHGG
jgi:NitT/TauT family transport system ATP-binding protein